MGFIDFFLELRCIGKMNELGVFDDGFFEFIFVLDRGLFFFCVDISVLV